MSSTDRNFRALLKHRVLAGDTNLCVGIDPDVSKLPGRWKDDPGQIFRFTAGIVDATADLVCAFKPQFAFFAANKAEGPLRDLIARVKTKTDVPVILDVKRGDIGKTAVAYAAEAFDCYGADALTVSPYLGFESIMPYLGDPNKEIFVLCRTSNSGSDEMQVQMVRHLNRAEQNAVESHLGRELESSFLPAYLWIAYQAATRWSDHGNIGLVAGATHPRELQLVRRMASGLNLLVPGYGAQGASAADAMSVESPGAKSIVVSAGKITHPDTAAVIDFTGHEEDYFDHVRSAAIRARDELRAARPNHAA